MKYKDAVKMLRKNDTINLVSTIIQLYEEKRHENFMKWIKKYPDYWLALCQLDMDKITPEYAKMVMKTLIDSNIIELKIICMFRYDNKLDIDGKASYYNES